MKNKCERCHKIKDCYHIKFIDDSDLILCYDCLNYFEENIGTSCEKCNLFDLYDNLHFNYDDERLYCTNCYFEILKGSDK